MKTAMRSEESGGAAGLPTIWIYRRLETDGFGKPGAWWRGSLQFVMQAQEWPFIRRVESLDAGQIAQLAELLVDCVEGGASVGFVLPISRERAAAFWARVARAVADGRRLMLVAEDARGICGTVQLVLDIAENQPHRADVVKLQVHSRARRCGLGAALMGEAERFARLEQRSVLVLDTVTGSDAARLYEKLGWVRVGDIPRYAMFPDGSMCSTTYYYKHLSM
jgi:GNAT superfamily N-acetyltransferase